MRLFLIAFIIALVSLMRFAGHQFLIDIPLWLDIALLPLAEGLHYMAVVFHECGHALAYTFFGIPAFPALDIHHGGGATYSYGRSEALLIGIYAVAAAMIAILAKKHPHKSAALLGFTLLHLLIVWRGWDIPLGMFMGHGAEVLTACWCFYRTYDQKKNIARAEKIVSLVLALHLAGRTLFLAFALVFFEMRRAAYGMQKGRKGSADLDKLGAGLGVSMETAAALLVVFMALAFAVTFALLYKRNRAKAS